MPVPAIRIVPRNAAPLRPEREFVLYWMTGARRTRWNFALQRAVEAAIEVGKPVVVLEAVRCDHRWASDRFHGFITDGMADNAERCAAAEVDYIPYVEPATGAGRGLLAALAGRACLVVADDIPCFFLPKMTTAAASRMDVRLETVDSNGLLPLRDAEVAFPTAYAFRRHLQKRLPVHLRELPDADPFAARGLRRGRALPPGTLKRWPSASHEPARLPIDHGVEPVAGVRGGEAAGNTTLETFVEERLGDYADDRNEPERDATSRLSPYLHFGHVSIHEVLIAVASREGWSPGDCATTAAGKREGWWGMSKSAEAFLDQAVTWRELGFNFCAHRRDYDRFDALPDWARRTLAEHAADPREHVYSVDELAGARTHDPLWNAAQTQLVREGRIHNYLRMLWGKKILQWTRSPEDALEAMIELNNRYALDGRDPNSYSGIFWVLGRYDRPWGPERPIFGVIRYMSSENTARKLKVREFLRRYGDAPPRF